MTKWKSRFFFSLKLSVSLCLLGYLAWLVDWQRAVAVIRETAKLPLLAVPFISLTGFWFASLRWRLILSDNHVKFSGWLAYRAYLLGMFYGNFLPGVLSGDGLRIGLCVQGSKCRIGTATASVLMERISGITALFCMAFLVYLVFPSIASSLLTTEDTRLIATMAVTGLSAIALVLMCRGVWVRWAPGENAKGLLGFIRTAMLMMGSLKGRTLGSVLVLSAIFQSADIVATFLLAKAMGLDLPLAVLFGVIPMVYIATVLPISLGGLGVREGTLVFLLSRFGVLASDAVTLSFLVYLNRMVIGGIGGSFQLMEALVGKLGHPSVGSGHTR